MSKAIRTGAERPRTEGELVRAATVGSIPWERWALRGLLYLFLVRNVLLFLHDLSLGDPAVSASAMIAATVAAAGLACSTRR